MRLKPVPAIRPVAATGSWFPNSFASSSPSPTSVANGQLIPAFAARSRYSWTVLSPIPQLRAICRCPNPTSNRNRKPLSLCAWTVSWPAPNLLFMDGVKCQLIVQRCYGSSYRSPVENIPLQAERYSADGKTVRLPTGIVFAFHRIPHQFNSTVANRALAQNPGQ
jgi:hypothetical protein